MDRDELKETLLKEQANLVALRQRTIEALNRATAELIRVEAKLELLESLG